MHVQNFCLCHDCIRRDTETADEMLAEKRRQAQAFVSACRNKVASVQVMDGVRRRTRAA